jgi:hypothetical protein
MLAAGLRKRSAAWQNIAMRNAIAKNLHVPLSPKLYKALHVAAHRQGRPATQVAREAIALWISTQRKRELEDELRKYVAHAAGGPDDLDEGLEAASIEHLTTPARRRQRR